MNSKQFKLLFMIRLHYICRVHSLIHIHTQNFNIFAYEEILSSSDVGVYVHFKENMHLGWKSLDPFAECWDGVGNISELVHTYWRFTLGRLEWISSRSNFTVLGEMIRKLYQSAEIFLALGKSKSHYAFDQYHNWMRVRSIQKSYLHNLNLILLTFF